MILSLFDYVIVFAETESFSFSNKEEIYKWLNELENTDIPISVNDSSKTASLYDKENNIYRIDIFTKSNLQSFDSTIDLGLILDVSNSMLFPSKLVEYKSNFDIYNINNSEETKRKLSNGEYYLIGDKSSTATVFKIFYDEDFWWAVDASKSIDDTTKFKIGIDSYRTSFISEASLYPFEDGDTVDSLYTIYKSGDNNEDNTIRTRLDALKDSVINVCDVVKRLLTKTSIAKNESDNPSLRIAYNTFNRSVNTYRPQFLSVFDPNSISISYQTGGGTHTDFALGLKDNLESSDHFGEDRSAATFEWTNNNNYAILFTDGIPQIGGSVITYDTMNEAATNLKDHNVSLITVGLSLENVNYGKDLLFNIASTNASGQKLFFDANNGDEVEAAFLQIVKKFVEPAGLKGNVKDVISNDFYPVDKTTGKALKVNDKIDLDGNLIVGTPTGKYGVVEKTNDYYVINWYNQNIQYTGWHGVVYIKPNSGVRGDDIPTNEGKATITVESYYFEEDNPIELSDEYKKTVELNPPYVDIRERKEDIRKIQLSDIQSINKVFPEIKDFENIIFDIKDPSVLKVENGIITPLKVGYTDIEFEYDNTFYILHIYVSNRETVEVPDTALNVPILVTIVGLLIAVMGIVFIVKNIKNENNNVRG